MSLLASTIPSNVVFFNSIIHSVESGVLHNHYADLSLAISDNIDVFASNLVQYRFAPQTTVTGIVSTLGVNNYQKATKLLEIVDSRFKTSSSGQSAKEFFNNFVLILATKLEHNNIAQALVASYSKFYVTFWNNNLLV